MTDEQNKICQALESCTSDHLSVAEQARITRDYGAEITEAAKKVYDETIGCPVDWSKASMDDGLSVMAQVCQDQYPWLTEEARRNLVHWFIMAWK